MEHNDKLKEAVWKEKKSGISTIWIVPIVALVIGAWLFYQSYMERGPQIEIVFKSGAGIEADKTVIKYKDIVVGKVKNVTFGEDLKSVRVTAEVKRNMREYLSENTRFWIVQAKLGMGEVQGLDTLLSGVYIVMDPQKGEERRKIFKGLDEIPVISSGEKGRTFTLKADNIGSLSVGSPIYYKHLRAGSVASYKLDPDGRKITIEVFIKSPFDKLVDTNTRFYNASGIDVSMSANGIDIRTEALVSILMGGLAFENFPVYGRGGPVTKGYTFSLFNDRKEAQQLIYKKAIYFWVYFDDSIRGLSVGAPVEFRGLKIGEVVSYYLIGNADTAEFKIPILVKIEPERFTIIGDRQDMNGTGVNLPVFEKLVKNGFRAQLQTGNLLTGELYIDLNLFPDAEPVAIKKEHGFYVIPSVPATLSSLKSSVKDVLKRIAGIPFEEIGNNLNGLLKELRSGTLPKIDTTIESVNILVRDTDKMMNTARTNYIDQNGEINRKINRLLDEFIRTSKSVKNLTDYLERHPESLIKGK